MCTYLNAFGVNHLLFIVEIDDISVLIGNVDLNLRPIQTFCTQIVQHNANAIFIFATVHTINLYNVWNHIDQTDYKYQKFSGEMTGRAIHRHTKFAIPFCFGIEQGNKEKDRLLKRVSVLNRNKETTISRLTFNEFSLDVIKGIMLSMSSFKQKNQCIPTHKYAYSQTCCAWYHTATTKNKFLIFSI